MWLTVAWWVVMGPSLVEVSVKDRKTSCTFFSFDPHLGNMVIIGCEVV